MATTINSHSIRHSRRFRNKKFHLKDGVMGEYLKIEPGSMLLRLVDVSEEDSSSAEKSKMADITWFTGNGFSKYNYTLKSGPSVYIIGMGNNFSKRFGILDFFIGKMQRNLVKLSRE